MDDLKSYVCFSACVVLAGTSIVFTEESLVFKVVKRCMRGVVDYIL